MPDVQVIFGAASVSLNSTFANTSDLEALFGVLKKHHVTKIDTAEIYGESEQLLGEASAGSHFSIDTKTPGGFGALMGNPRDTSATVTAATSSIREKLQVDKVDVFYLHSPQDEEPHEQTLQAVNTLHESGLFSRFGLSNFSARQVQDVHDYCAAKGFVRPSVYQGNYSAVARGHETALLPTLRKLGIAFFAYSPTAGGFLAKSRSQVEANEGRFGNDELVGKMYKGMYGGKPALLSFLDRWGEIAEAEGVSRVELALRWVRFHSGLKGELGDGIVVGVSGLGQLEQTLVGLEKGELGAETVTAIEGLWEGVEGLVPLDNYVFVKSGGLA